MTTATVSRGARSVTMEIYERAGALHIARDVGHPQARVYRTGKGDPRASSHRAPIDAFTVTGQLVGPGAYEDARVLAEDIVKPHSGGTDATLDLSAVTGLSSYNVGFGGDAALRLHYPKGQGEWVSVQFTAIVTTDTYGGSTMGDAGTAGSGAGEVTISDGTNTLRLDSNLEVQREVGRPDAGPRYSTGDDPYFVDRPRASSDTFELSALWITDAETNASTLVDNIIKPPLGFGTLTLDFDGLYGLGSYSVAPIDTRSCRVSWSAGEKGMVSLDTLKLHVVDNS